MTNKISEDTALKIAARVWLDADMERQHVRRSFISKIAAIIYESVNLESIDPDKMSFDKSVGYPKVFESNTGKRIVYRLESVDISPENSDA